MTSHIPTLLLREWMQHKRGWLIAALAPPLLFLLLLLIPKANVQGLPSEHLEMTALMVMGICAAAVYGICVLVALFQLPGLARRDVQDRSIEFWLSLPGRPTESVGATVLAHAWLAPLGGLLAGSLLGLPVAMAVVAKQEGLAAAWGVHWGPVLMAGLPLLLRAVAGTLLMLVALLPVILTLMAASAWLKRLGVPVVLVGGAAAVTTLYKAYDITWPLDALKALERHVNYAMITDARVLMKTLQADDSAWAWAASDLGQALTQFASLPFLGWAAVAAVGFALVVVKRSRGG